ncbi:MAG: glycosyltransferase, partial [Rhodothermales bacterium]|nr:glycosyltransferase [Rhodothermales bacterium]
MTTDIAFVLTGDPFRNARALKQVRALAHAGHRVLLLGIEGDAPHPDLPQNVHVERLPRPPGSGPAWFHAVHRAFRTRLMSLDARCFHASDLYALPSCSAGARRNGACLTYDARELYTAVASVSGRPLVRAFWRWIEHRHIRRTNAVFTVSGSIADELARRYPIERPVLLPNVPDESGRLSGPGLRELLRRVGVPTGEDEPLILHLGQMRSDRGCDVLIDAFDRLAGDAAVADAGARARLVFLGYGPEEAGLRARATSTRVADRIHFLAPVDPDRVHAAISDAAVGVTLLQDSCLNHRYALPNKLFDYFHAGLPVLAARLPEIERVVDGEGLGLTVEPN